MAPPPVQLRQRFSFFLTFLLLAGITVAFFAWNAPLGPQPPDCADVRHFCVGLVAAAGEWQEGDLNQRTWDALRRSKIADWVQFLKTNDARDYARNIAFFAQQGYDVIVTVGSAAGEDTLRAAEKYPDCYFIGVDQPQSVARENLVGLVFAEDKAGFLAGVLAALTSETGRLGAICSTRAIPAYWRYCEGFRAGAQYADAGVQVNVLYNDSYPSSRAVNAQAWAESSTRMLVSLGVDVIFADPTATGQAALRTAVAERTRMIAVGRDYALQWPEARPYLLTSILPLPEAGLLILVRKAARAQAGSAPCAPAFSPDHLSTTTVGRAACALASAFPPGNFEGAVGYAPFYDQESRIPAEAKSMLEATRRALTEGRLETGVPPEKP